MFPKVFNGLSKMVEMWSRVFNGKFLNYRQLAKKKTPYVHIYIYIWIFPINGARRFRRGLYDDDDDRRRPLKVRRLIKMCTRGSTPHSTEHITQTNIAYTAKSLLIRAFLHVSLGIIA